MAIKSMAKWCRVGLAGWVAVACLLMPCGGVAWGQWEQTHKLTADDAADHAHFGTSVSVSGNTIIVGSPDDHAVDVNSGSAYVFDAATGQQLHKLTADDAAAWDCFGVSVSVSGDTIVVGAYGDDDGGSVAGSAYVFDATTGQQLHKLIADDAAAGDRFGVSVSISGDTIVVGAYGDDGSSSDSGSAYVFDATTGQQLHKLTADDAAADDYFGVSVSIGGDAIVVGAYYDDDAGPDSGSAYVFDANTGQQLHKLTADDAAAEDHFGVSVSVSEDTIVVGAYGDDDAGIWSGSAYVFDVATGQQLHKLAAEDAEEYQEFGVSVTLSGNTAVIGSRADDDEGYLSGSAYVFEAATGQQLQKLIADDAAAADYFGMSVSIDGNTIVVGAGYKDHAGYDSGSAYVFQSPDTYCPEDVNNDEVVDIDDLFQVLAAWGPCEGCPEDINDDGVVDIDDLFAVLAAWGPCTCELDCDGAQLEQEECGEDTNGGCDFDPNDPNSYEEIIECGVPLCGTAWADTSTRDTDWYLLDVPDLGGGGAEVVITFASQFFGLCGVLPDDCEVTEFTDFVTSDQCEEVTLTTWMWAGNNIIWVGPADLYDLPCGTGSQYKFIANCQQGEPPPICDWLYDDGTHENALGLSGSGEWDITWAHWWDATDLGCGWLTTVQIAWGDCPPGTTSVVYIFNDPNNDGNPSDIRVANDLLASMNVVSDEEDTSTFIDYPIGPVAVDDVFFVTVVTHGFDGEYPAAMDETYPTTNGVAWLNYNMDPADPWAPGGSGPVLMENVGYPCEWMIRAIGTDEPPGKGDGAAGCSAPPPATSSMPAATARRLSTTSPRYSRPGDPADNR